MWPVAGNKMNKLLIDCKCKLKLPVLPTLMKYFRIFTYRWYCSQNFSVLDLVCSRSTYRSWILIILPITSDSSRGFSGFSRWLSRSLLIFRGMPNLSSLMCQNKNHLQLILPLCTHCQCFQCLHRFQIRFHNRYKNQILCQIGQIHYCSCPFWD